jgi:predicted RNase H-like nuclease
MTVIAGVDGCKSGWICITRDLTTGSVDSAVYLDIQKLLKQTLDPVVIAVDIPIGLTESEPRQCDLEARKILGKRRSSVFPAPIRPVLHMKAYEEANSAHKQITGKGISKQSYAICKKILEVDRVLSEHTDLQKKIKEIHPEICFWALNKKKPMSHNKKTTDGLLNRRKLIVDYFGNEALKDARSKHFCKDVADDDIHDAFAALWTAERIYKNAAGRIPKDPPRDEMGLYMEMWY